MFCVPAAAAPRPSPIRRTGAPALIRAAGRLAIVLPLAFAAAPPAFARSAPDSFADLAEKLLPAVVNVSTTQTIKSTEHKGKGPDVPQFPPGSPFEEFFKDFMERQQRGDRPDAPPRRATSLGSGFIIDPAGYVVTNNHVVAEADEINITLHDDTTFKATLVGRDIKTDLALLKVESKKPLTAVAWGDSDQTRVGDWVLAIGNPFGLGGSVTAGILSARGRDIQSGAYDDYLQTDASINRGNSGGPMFNTVGEVIGINTAIYSPTGGSVGIGFAIPASLAKPVIDQLKKYGKVRRGWLGVRIQSVTDELAESLGLDKPRGALVSSASEGGPAAKAKIEPGDVILRFDGKEITEMRRLPRIVAETPIDKPVEVVVWRKKKEVPLKVQVGELVETDQVASAAPGPSGPPSGAAGSVTELGLQLSAVSQPLREKYGLADDAQGVVVTDVSGASPAGEKGVKPGDIIVEVGQEEVKTPADVTAKIKAARDAKRKSVLLLIDQKGDLRFVAVRIDG
jgi:serine protease Do